jgi:uncharacterized protein (TIGR02246 family)
MKPKKTFVFYFLLPLLLISGCKNISNELSEVEKNNIKEEVRNILEKGIIAANKHDPDAMMKVHWKSDEYLAIYNGTSVKGWETCNEMVSYVHSNPRNQSFTIEQQVVDIRVLNNLTAFVIAKGKFINVPTRDSTITEEFAETMLVEKIDGTWKITAVHESWLSSDLFAE